MAMLKADTEYRRRALALCLLLALLGFAAIRWGLPAIEQYVREKPPERGLRVLQVVWVLLFLPLVAMAAYLYRLGRRVLASATFPPPGVKVIRDTAILEGDRARRKGYLLLALSISMLVVGLSGAMFLPYMLGELVKIGP